jgi:hypothetical protein
MFSLWIALMVGCQTPDPAQTDLRRLTPNQYNLTVQELLGFADGDWPDTEDERQAWPWVFPADIEIHGFAGMAEGQVSSSYLVEQYQLAASHFANFVTDAPYFWTCVDREDLGDQALVSCAQDSILRLAHRAYRRPLTDDERGRLLAFHQSNIDAWGLERGIRVTTQGLLVSPQFLYMLEDQAAQGTPERLDAFELATRLSYFLWDTMPDASLFEAAATGKLETKEQVAEQARRMLVDDRARRSVVRFHHQWLDLDRVYAANPDMATYQPTYLPEAPTLVDPEEELGVEAMEEVWSSFLIAARAAMVAEAELFVERTLFDGDGTLGTLLTDNHGFVSQIEHPMGDPLSTSRLYGSVTLMDADPIRRRFEDGNFDYAIEIQAAEFSADERAGILTLPAVLTTLAHPVHPAPILRGVFLKERLLCEAVGQPPDGAETAAPADSLEVESTNRVRTEAATSPAGCAACHDQINPLGFAFENFDSMGGWRTTDNGLPVDASGTLVRTGQDFTHAASLSRHLAESRQVHDCYALQWARYASGQSHLSKEEITDIQETFFQTGGDVQQLLVDIVTSDMFRYRSEGAP